VYSKKQTDFSGYLGLLENYILYKYSLSNKIRESQNDYSMLHCNVEQEKGEICRIDYNKGKITLHLVIKEGLTSLGGIS